MKYPRLATEEVKRGRVSLEAQQAREKAWHAKHGPNVFPDDDGNPVEAKKALKPAVKGSGPVVAAMAATPKQPPVVVNVASPVTTPATAPTVGVAKCGTPLQKQMYVKRLLGKDGIFYKTGRVVRVDDNYSFVAWKDGHSFWFPNKGLIVDE